MGTFRVKRLVQGTLLGAALISGACSHKAAKPLPVMPEEPPKYVEVPHPQGLDIGDIEAIFALKDAPSREEFKDCDKDFRTLRDKTKSKLEIEQGAREMVERDPVRYHYCFYSKMLELEDKLKSNAFIDERQKTLIDTYVFLTPIARAFHQQYRDSRYLRTAIFRYRQASEVVFYRRLELNPQTLADLGGLQNPWASYRPPAEAPASVLEKYGIVKPTEKPLAEEKPSLAGPVPDTQPLAISSPEPQPEQAQPVSDEASREPASQPNSNEFKANE